VKGIELTGPQLVWLCKIGLVLGGGGYSSSSSNYYTESLSSVKTTCCSPTEEMRKNLSTIMERLLEASIDSPNMLREYLERGAGDNRGWAEDPS
jgi:hypothetical protein